MLQTIEEFLIGKTYYNGHGFNNIGSYHSTSTFKVYFSLSDIYLQPIYTLENMVSWHVSLNTIILEIKNNKHKYNKSIILEMTELFPEFII